MRYPGAARAVLDGADFEVAMGEHVAILGPSGSGKSTLLSVLGGLVVPVAGNVGVQHEDGRSGAGTAVSVREVTSWVLQTTNVLPERSALDNVAVAALTQGLSRPRALEVAARHLADVGLAALAHTPARKLSGGEVQRVVIARALASRRPFILADEPTGQLDRATSDVVLDALFSSAAGSGVVVVTHDQAVADRCMRVVRIQDAAVVVA